MKRTMDEMEMEEKNIMHSFTMRKNFAVWHISLAQMGQKYFFVSPCFSSIVFSWLNRLAVSAFVFKIPIIINILYVGGAGGE